MTEALAAVRDRIGDLLGIRSDETASQNRVHRTRRGSVAERGSGGQSDIAASNAKPLSTGSSEPITGSRG